MMSDIFFSSSSFSLMWEKTEEMTFVHMKKKFIDKNKHFYTAKKVHTHIKLMHMQKSIKYTTKKTQKKPKTYWLLLSLLSL